MLLYLILFSIFNFKVELGKTCRARHLCWVLLVILHCELLYLGSYLADNRSSKHGHSSLTIRLTLNTDTEQTKRLSRYIISGRGVEGPCCHTTRRTNQANMTQVDWTTKPATSAGGSQIGALRTKKPRFRSGLQLEPS